MGAQVSNKALIGALPLIAQALGDKYGVKVVFGNYETAATNGSTIFMPHLPVEGEAVGIIANGFIDHESAHIRETDFAVFAIKKPAIEQHLLNILEDLRIEQRQMDRYPGSRKHLSRLVAHFVKSGKAFTMPEGAPQDCHPAQELVNSALIIGRRHVLEQEALEEVSLVYEQRFPELFGNGALVRLHALLAQAPLCQNTRQCWMLAKKILKMIEEEEEKNKPEPPQDDQDSSDDSDDSGDQDDSDDQDGSDSSDDADDQDDSGSQDSSDNSGSYGDQDDQDDSGDQDSSGNSDDSDKQDDSDDPDSSGNGSKSPASSDDDDSSEGGQGSSPDSTDSISKKIADASDDDIDVKSDLGDAIADNLSSELDAVPNESGYSTAIGDIGDVESKSVERGYEKVTRSDVRQATVKLRARLQAKIESAVREKKYLSQSGRRVCSRAMSRVRTGDSRIFNQKEEKKGLDTAIKILVDRSGSMGFVDKRNQDAVAPISPAMKSAMAVMAALEGINGVTTACSAFPSTETLTGFNESLVKTAKRYECYTTGGTPMTEAMLWCVKHHLAPRRENRKIFIVVTDGEPDNPVTAQAVIRKMAQAGIEMIGVGIGSDAHYVKSLFPTSDVIESVDELPETLFKLIHNKFN